MENYIIEKNVVMLSEGSHKDLKDIHTKDTLLGWDGFNFVPTNITEIRKDTPSTKYIVEVGNRTVTVSPTNGFWLDGGKEVLASELVSGVSKVYVKEGNTIKSETVTGVYLEPNTEVLNTVCGTTYRNFLVNGILLHNFDIEDYIFQDPNALPFPLLPVIGPGSGAFAIDDGSPTEGRPVLADPLSTARATMDSYFNAQGELFLAIFGPTMTKDFPKEKKEALNQAFADRAEVMKDIRYWHAVLSLGSEGEVEPDVIVDGDIITITDDLSGDYPGNVKVTAERTPEETIAIDPKYLTFFNKEAYENLQYAITTLQCITASILKLGLDWNLYQSYDGYGLKSFGPWAGVKSYDRPPAPPIP
jgi:hypothetical protein